MRKKIRKNKKISKEKLAFLKKLKESPQIDRVDLKNIIIGKKAWIKSEIAKGLRQQENLKIQLERLQGMLMFIDDLMQPPLQTGFKEEK